MTAHESIDDLTATEEARLRGGFPKAIRTGAHVVDSAIGRAAADLRDTEKDSVEYAVKVASLFAEGDFLLRKGWVRLMPILATIRPELKQGRRSDPPPPAYFGDRWPHQRLGYDTWAAFVEAEPKGIYAEDGRTLVRGPGLGWSVKYESDLFRGWKRLCQLVGLAMPAASPAEIEARVEAEAEALGPNQLMLGFGRNSIVHYTISPHDAEEGLAAVRSSKAIPRISIPRALTVEALAKQLRDRFKDEPTELRRLIELLGADL